MKEAFGSDVFAVMLDVVPADLVELPAGCYFVDPGC